MTPSHHTTLLPIIREIAAVNEALARDFKNTHGNSLGDANEARKRMRELVGRLEGEVGRWKDL